MVNIPKKIDNSKPSKGLSKSILSHPVTLFKGVDTTTIEHTTFENLFCDNMRNNDQVREATKQIDQSIADNKYKDVRKDIAPGFVMGHVDKRGSKKDTDYPYLLGFDFDNVELKPNVAVIIEKLNQIEYVSFACPSLSFKGVRAFVYYPSSKDDFKEAYLEIATDLSNKTGIPLRSETNKDKEHLDTTTKDPFRLWFYRHLSEDDLFFINPSALPFERKERLPIRPQEGREETENSSSKYFIEFTDEEKVQDITRQIIGSKTDITRGQDWFIKVLLPTAGYYGEAGRSLAQDLSQFHADYTASATDKEYDRAIEKSNGSVGIASFLHHAKDCGFTYDKDWIINQRNKNSTIAAPVKSKEDLSNPKEFPNYFYVQQEKGIQKIVLDYLAFVNHLRDDLGFIRYDIEDQFSILHCKDKVVKEVSIHQIVDEFISFIDRWPVEELREKITKEQLKNKIYGAGNNYFTPFRLGRLRPKRSINFNEHSRKKAFFYFKNSFVEVTAANCVIKSYSQLHKYVWENHILKREIKKVDQEHYKESNFYKFVKNIAGAWKIHPQTGAENLAFDPTRLSAFKTVIGYLLHSSFEGELKAILFTDSKISSDNESNGRSGKTLLLKSLGLFLNRSNESRTYVEANGKDWDPAKSFKWQEVALDTKLIHLNDVKRNFDVECLYNDITEGVRRERKNEISYKVQTKIALSSNSTVRVRGASARGRILEVELSDYYNDTFSPYEEFGEWFFADWTAKGWLHFDNFLLDCVRIYLEKGLTKPEPINLSERKKIEETAVEFVEWMEERVSLFLGPTKEFDKADLFEQFKSEYIDFKDLKQRQFNKYLNLFCDYDERFKSLTKELERKSNGKVLIRFKATEGKRSN